jgi:hypothetical protein
VKRAPWPTAKLLAFGGSVLALALLVEAAILLRAPPSSGLRPDTTAHAAPEHEGAAELPTTTAPTALPEASPRAAAFRIDARGESCPERRRVRFDPERWAETLRRAPDRSALEGVLRDVGVIQPFGDDGERRLSCRARPTLERADIVRASLSAPQSKDLVLTATFSVCSVPLHDEAEGDTRDVLSIAVVVRRDDGVACTLKAFHNRHSPPTSQPRMEHPEKPGSASPLDVTLLHLTSETTATLRVETSDGSCGMYPRSSRFDLSFFDVRGFELVERFSRVTFEEVHAVAPGPSSRASVEPFGHFPKQLRVVAEQACGDREEAPGRFGPCEPKRTREVYRLGAERYEPILAERREQALTEDPF